MLNNLYVFAIGGSGERVMYSFLMELVAGMPIKANKIIPVFIDNDEQSPALTDCRNLINYYSGDGLNGRILGAQTLNKAFSTDSKEWPSFYHVNIGTPIVLNQAGDGMGTLDNVIGPLDDQDEIQHDIIEEKELLFSDDDLSMPLNVGFVGQPNIGSVVLNSKALQSDEFQEILNGVTQRDGVIIIGSLFGGTGAAGLPLIAHQFETKPQQQRPLIGAIAMLPYFKTDKTRRRDQNIIDIQKWDVNSDSFDTKTRAALMYYDKHLNKIDCLYYVGCDKKAIYTHSVGSTEQKNPVHLVEVLSAMSIFDFANLTRPNAIEYRIPTWIVDDNADSNVLGVTNHELQKAIVKFQMMTLLFQKDVFIKEDIQNNTLPYISNLGITETIRKAIVDNADQFPQAIGLNNLLKEWDKWCQGLAIAGTAKFSIVRKDNDILEENVTQKFYGDEQWGIAKTKMVGVFKKEPDKIKPQIKNELRAAYANVFPKGSKEDAQRMNDQKRISALMKVISDALDNVIQKYTIL